MPQGAAWGSKAAAGGGAGACAAQKPLATSAREAGALTKRHTHSPPCCPCANLSQLGKGQQEPTPQSQVRGMSGAGAAARGAGALTPRDQLPRAETGKGRLLPVRHGRCELEGGRGCAGCDSAGPPDQGPRTGNKRGRSVLTALEVGVGCWRGASPGAAADFRHLHLVGDSWPA